MPAAYTRDDLIAHFHHYGAPRDGWRIGVELERHLLRPNGLPVPYFGEHGVKWLLERMAPNGWKVKNEGENPIALFRKDGSVTLEPGSQWEYSGAPHESIATIEAEARAFIHETDRAIGDAPITQVALGYTPFAAMDEIPWVPKGRYVIMKEHLGKTGDLAHDMMKGTCAVQASYDFSDEADCARKVGLGILIGPLTTAIFANSPLSRGRPNGWASYRGHVWTHTDPRRTGFPDAARAFSFEKWVDYLLDVPMMFLYDEQHGWRAAKGLSFRKWMEDGVDGTFPDLDAWDLHLTSVFPEVRVKKLIEIRGADCVSHPLAMAFTAFFTGLLYDDRARDAAIDVGLAFASHGTTAERFDVACRDGLTGTIGGRRLSSWAEDLVQLAASGMSRWAPNDAHFIQPLITQVQSGESPSAAILRAYARDPSPASILAAARFSA
jgi:glutamate--cysteine ligase